MTRVLDASPSLFDQNPFSPVNGEQEKLSRAAFNFSFSRKDVQRLNGKNALKSTVSNSESHIDQMANSRISPMLSRPSSFLDEEHWPYVWSWVPRRLRQMDVELVFSTDAHGYFLETFYESCSDEEPQLMFIETTEGAIFGAYLSDHWGKRKRPNSFFGSAESRRCEVAGCGAITHARP